jgi:hypothetical protein
MPDGGGAGQSWDHGGPLASPDLFHHAPVRNRPARSDSRTKAARTRPGSRSGLPVDDPEEGPPRADVDPIAVGERRLDLGEVVQVVDDP